MALSRSRPVYTVDEYLELERASSERHEYLDGLVYAMAGESGEHADICANLVFIIVGQLKGKACRARSKDIKVRSGPNPKPRQGNSGLYSYPDLVVLCGEPQYHDDHADIILNPTVIIEVLSPTTEAFERGEKFRRYQMWNQSLTDYLLILQDRPQVEYFAKSSEGSWLYNRIEGLESCVTIPSIECQLRLVDVYDRISFSNV